MIRDIEIENYKCYGQLSINGCKRINVIVGDNGSGKTALLEAIFLALGSTTELIGRYRGQRGQHLQFAASARRIEDAFWSDIFYRQDLTKRIRIALSGSGDEARSVSIGRGKASSELPLAGGEATSAIVPIVFAWRDASGRTHEVSPKIQDGRLHFPETGEDLPDFFYFAANQNPGGLEIAERFSNLSRANRLPDFTKHFYGEYPWIRDLSIEVQAGATAVYASVDGVPNKIPLSATSSGINRVFALLATIASRPRSVIVIDEAENGLFHTHHKGLWHALLSFARSYESQLFVTTHNEEWLSALADAAGKSVDDISLWRTERSDAGAVVRQFSGDDLVNGLEFGEEVR